MKTYYIVVLILVLISFCTLTTDAQQSTASRNVTARVTVTPGVQIQGLQDLLPDGIWSQSDGMSFTVQTSHPEILRTLGLAYTILSEPAHSGNPRHSATVVPGIASAGIQSLVDEVSADSCLSHIQALEGFVTRFQYGDSIERAAEYIHDQFELLGLQTTYDTFELPSTAVTFSDCKMGSPDTGVAVGSVGVYRTTNGGLSWGPVGSPGTWFYGTCFRTPLNIWVCGTGGVIIRTTDAGAAWSTETWGTTASLFDIGFGPGLTGLMVGDYGTILRTSDGGTTWSTVSSGVSVRIRGLSVTDDLHAWAVGENGTVLKTTTGGLSWDAQYPSAALSNYLRDVSFVDSLHGWASGYGTTVIRTSDGGTNWVRLAPPGGVGAYVYGIAFADTLHGWIVGNGGQVYSTSDGGETWAIVSVAGPQSGQLIQVNILDPSHLVACGTNATILLSSDGGTTWQNQHDALPGDLFRKARNVVATLPGTVTPENECVIVGHYDSNSNDPYNSAPGANDNATGTAAVLEAARICVGHEFKSTITFLAVAGEELGLYGSAHYAATAKSEGRIIDGVVNGDMIGYPASGNDTTLAVDCYEHYTPLLDSVLVYNARYGIGLAINDVVDYSGGSDHVSFTQAGYSAVEVAEATAAEIWGGADPYYHSTTDTHEKISIGLLQRAVKLMVATVAELARPVTGQTVWVSYTQKWNMISIPVALSDLSVNAVFPMAVSRAFLYDGQYQPVDTFRVGSGYWIKLNSEQTIAMTGMAVNSVTVPVRAGWNIIGAPAITLSVTDITPEPADMRLSGYYGYQSQYYISETLTPGHAYWVKSDQTGTLTLAAAGTSRTASLTAGRLVAEMPPPPPDDISTIVPQPMEYALDEVYPNPFNSTTRITYQLPNESKITIKIYDPLGREVVTILETVQEAGRKSIEWNGNGAGSGIYFFKLEATSVSSPERTFTGIKKLVLVK